MSEVWISENTLNKDWDHMVEHDVTCSKSYEKKLCKIS